jgi:ABC-2 type transport system ATP-binding protein
MQNNEIFLNTGAAPVNAPLLECRSLCKSYGALPVLFNWNITIVKGRIVGLLGPNGSGKTTLIKLINGLLTPTSGEVLICGNRPGVESKKVISYLPDKDALDSSMRVENTIELYKDFFEDFSEERMYGMLKRLNIDPVTKIGTLSKGNREKVRLILTMSREAKLYVLDEPIGGVDPAARDYILDTIIKNYSPESSILLSTHLISDVERILDDVIFVSNGQIMLAEAADNIRAQGKSVDQLFRETYRF